MPQTKKPRWRYCHARSARKHRKQHAYVKFSHWSSRGRAVYAWRPANIGQIVQNFIAHLTASTK